MYGYQAVMEANGKFVGRVGVVLDPIPYVIEHLAQRNFDQMWRDAEIALRRSKFACPAPDTFEHAPMQALEKTFPRRNLGLSATPQHPIIVFVLKAQTVTQIRSREFANTIGFLCSRPCRKSSSTR